MASCELRNALLFGMDFRCEFLIDRLARADTHDHHGDDVALDLVNNSKAPDTEGIESRKVIPQQLSYPGISTNLF